MELIPRPEHLVPYAVVRCSWVYPSPSFPPGPISVFDGAILTTCVNSSQPILPISSYTSDPNASARSPAFSSGTPMQHGLCSTESTTGINCLIQSPASSSPATGSGRSLLMTPGQISSPVLSATDSVSQLHSFTLILYVINFF
ncbi:unnamed protein product [Protopolystoma xenopodis]|uniref:Uncharacterized protein n=1 Tax=Protopolystoma xenopodis TaxID=117903 RepID=A0A448XAB3_9PLAT|nr:unnamed protein product [Protopolystoma xenopodis]